MKNLTLILCVILSNLSFSQTTIIPDPNFEQALIDLGFDSTLDGSVLTNDISGISYLNVSSYGIADLTGIEEFTSLTTLTCYSNLLSNLDISQNTNLTNLNCGLNFITALDLSQNIALTDLSCHYNQLTSLDVSQNTNLGSLTIHLNSLTSLDVSQNSALTVLSCNSNQLTNLDVSQNTALIILGCASNQLINLDVSQNNVLSLLNCSDNNLNCLNVKNGNSANMNTFMAQNNPNLICIEVDDVTYSINNWTNIPATASFSSYCNNACSVGIEEIEISGSKELINIIDLMGKKTEEKLNTLQIYIYNDGTTERIFRVE